MPLLKPVKTSLRMHKTYWRTTRVMLTRLCATQYISRYLEDKSTSFQVANAAHPPNISVHEKNVLQTHEEATAVNAHTAPCNSKATRASIVVLSFASRTLEPLNVRPVSANEAPCVPAIGSAYRQLSRWMQRQPRWQRK